MISRYIILNPTGNAIVPPSCSSKSDAQLAAENSDDTNLQILYRN